MNEDTIWIGALVKFPSMIAIDGPAASGKSTLGKNLAEALGYLYFDTGVMYRALTWHALFLGISVNDGQAVTTLAENTPIDVKPASKQDGRAYDVFIDGRDITWEIREDQVDANVSVVSAYAGVRKALTEQQRRIGLRGRVVMVGRDIGTVVLPEADLKIYLDASLHERARRRYEENRSRSISASQESIEQAMLERDRFDSNRTIAPLRPAKDAVIINTDNINPTQLLAHILGTIQRNAD